MSEQKSVVLERCHIRTLFDVVSNIKNKNCTSIASVSNAANITYSQVHRIVRKFVALGILERKKDGRQWILSTTPKGSKLAAALDVIVSSFSEEQK